MPFGVLSEGGHGSVSALFSSGQGQAAGGMISVWAKIFDRSSLARNVSEWEEPAQTKKILRPTNVTIP